MHEQNARLGVSKIWTPRRDDAGGLLLVPYLDARRSPNKTGLEYAILPACAAHAVVISD
jgi:hypothetical protein